MTGKLSYGGKEMTNFKSIRVVGWTALLVAACLFTVHSAQAQSHNLQVTVPFDFFAGDVRVPAGDYKVEPVVGNVVRLYNPASRASFAFPTMSISKTLGGFSSPKLIFNKYGADHFLFEMWWGHGGVGISPIRSKVELELAKALRPVRVEARARRPE
jgi:hypothetical protein